jgi:hypothetical protein
MIVHTLEVHCFSQLRKHDCFIVDVLEDATVKVTHFWIKGRCPRRTKPIQLANWNSQKEFVGFFDIACVDNIQDSLNVSI